MTQQTSPFLEGKYGWNFGESGWNSGMDENLLKFSFMFDRNVDGVVASLPAAVNGQAYYLTTDNRLYFAVGTTWFSTPVPKWFEFTIRSSGDLYRFNGVSPVQIDNPTQIDTRLDALELTVSTLGTAAFQNTEFFATQAALDVESAASAAYTDLLRSDLAAATGASLVGFGSTTVENELNDRKTVFRTIESFGLVDTPANTLVTMQAAIDYCAANNILLVNGSSEYTVDFSSSSITIPDNFRCDLGNAWIKRATGNTTPQDMWINVDTTLGNTGIDIRNVRFDGQRTADSLTNVTPSHRFCGLRLVKCSGYLENVRADNTVNGEIQVEGTRGGIMLDQSADMRAFKLYASGTNGSGVFPYQGKNYILGVWATNNTGSGFTSFGCDDNDFHHIYSDGSGFSGVSVNGERMRCSFLSSKNSPLNYAGVNIGHDAAGNRATGSIIDNVMVESALGWGITCIGSPDVSGANWVASGSTVNNLRVVNSPGLDVTYKGLASLSTDTFISGGGDPHMIKAYITDAAFNGLATGGSSTRVIMHDQSYITGCGTAGGTTGAVNAADTTTVEVRGKIENNLRYGVISNGATALADIIGATVRGSGVSNFLSASSGVLRHERVRTSTDAMQGTVTATASATTVTVNNGNSQAVDRVLVWAGNSSAVMRQPFVNTVSPGVSFTFTLPSAAAGTEVYYWRII